MISLICEIIFLHKRFLFGDLFWDFVGMPINITVYIKSLFMNLVFLVGLSAPFNVIFYKTKNSKIAKKFAKLSQTFDIKNRT